MYALLNLLGTVIGFISFMLFVYIVLSWLVAFGVVNGHNRVVYMINDTLYKFTDPLLRPFRRWQRRMFPKWQIDLSPVILLLALHFIKDLLQYDIPRLIGY